ncbi:MAG: 1-acyl-sn-glycerol-3-phosphate acyltransferase [Planctomycetota bacterium]
MPGLRQGPRAHRGHDRGRLAAHRRPGAAGREGNLYVVGRLKDAIVDASGNTVHPDEVEDLYSGCEDVEELAVAGIAQKGDQHEVVAALVRAKRDAEGGVADAEERIREFFQQRAEALPYPKRVKVLRFTQRELPRTATRKVKRAEVAKLLQDLARKTEARASRKQRKGTGGERFAQIFQDVAGIDPTLVTREANLTDDLGLDSIALAEVALALAEAYECPAPESLAGAATVGDLLGLIGVEGEGKRSVAPQTAPARPIVMPSLVKRGVRTFLDTLHQVGYGQALECTVVGRGNIPHHTNTIVVANHSSHLDVGLVRYALGEYGEHLVSAGARDYFFADTFRATYFENFTNVMPFDRVASVRESLGRFVDQLNQGKTILIFPEGTRSISGRMASFKPGLGLVVQAAKVGVLPIYLSGTHVSMPKGSWLPRRTPLEARIGKFLPAEQLLAKTAHLGRRQQATQIVEVVRQNLVALRDKQPFDLARWEVPQDAKGARRRRRGGEGQEAVGAASEGEA